LLRDALARLADADVVLGPALDGGYYLVAIRRAAAQAALASLFTDIPWGSAEVLQRTLDAAYGAELSVALLGELADVDRPEDVPAAVALLDTRERSPQADARVSVVIPALDDEELVGAAVQSALAEGAAEVIVVDGGSSDDTRGRAEAAGACVITAAGRGRALQMNTGAARATGSVLLFLHADSRLPAVAIPLALAALSRPGVVAGAYGFAVYRESRYARVLTFAGRWRARFWRHPHGDQGLFMRASTFHAMGGYPQQPTMEDWEMVARLKRLGHIALLHEEAQTSARAWDEHGLLYPTALNAAVIAGYRLGVSPDRLAEWRSRIAPRTRARHDTR
jgi:rSAM/selenodomain-associated transferase 2